jgi:hypothetical protein
MNELADGAAASYTTHSIHTYNFISIHAFLLAAKLQMCDRVIFPLTENHVFHSNSVASRALGLNSLHPHSFTLYYLTLE